jgi:hypothetical protein
LTTTVATVPRLSFKCFSSLTVARDKEDISIELS